MEGLFYCKLLSIQPKPQMQCRTVQEQKQGTNLRSSSYCCYKGRKFPGKRVSGIEKARSFWYKFLQMKRNRIFREYKLLRFSKNHEFRAKSISIQLTFSSISFHSLPTQQQKHHITSESFFSRKFLPLKYFARGLISGAKF